MSNRKISSGDERLQTGNVCKFGNVGAGPDAVIASGTASDDGPLPEKPEHLLALLKDMCAVSLAGKCRFRNGTIGGKSLSFSGLLVETAGLACLAWCVWTRQPIWLVPAVVVWSLGYWLVSRGRWQVDQKAQFFEIGGRKFPLSTICREDFSLYRIGRQQYWVRFARDGREKLLICFATDALAARYCSLLLELCRRFVEEHDASSEK